VRGFVARLLPRQLQLALGRGRRARLHFFPWWAAVPAKK
jgi:hypothetical protein